MSTGTAVISQKSTSPFSVFRHRNFSLMWTGQFVETIGFGLTSRQLQSWFTADRWPALSVD
jgi:hypothetical protein